VQGVLSDGGSMKISLITVIAAITAVSAWGAKALAIGLAGGLGESPLETPLFVLGALGLVVAMPSLGWTLAWGRPVALRALASVGACVAGIACSMTVLALVSAFVSSDHWAWSELNLWVPAVALLAFVAIRREGTLRRPVQSGAGPALANAAASSVQDRKPRLR
jgi:hypothetical protein